MKVLVTGCRGFVGSSFGRFAASSGHEILGIARSSQPDVSWQGQYIQADVLYTDLTAIIREFRPDVVLHAAGTASVGASLETPLDDLRAAVMTWANTLEGIRRSGVRPVILFPSSAAVYGNPARLPVSEDAPIQPMSPYGFHKAACELVAREYSECFGLDIILCRLFSVFGQWQRRLLVWEIFQQLVGPDPVAWLKGTGAETRDYLASDDVAAAMLELAMARLENQVGQCLAVNVASGEETTILDLARLMRDIIAPGKDVHCHGEERPGDPKRWRADIARLHDLAPRIQPQPFRDSLTECLAVWQAENPSGYKSTKKSL